MFEIVELWERFWNDYDMTMDIVLRLICQKKKRKKK